MDLKLKEVLSLKFWILLDVFVIIVMFQKYCEADSLKEMKDHFYLTTIWCRNIKSKSKSKRNNFL